MSAGGNTEKFDVVGGSSGEEEEEEGGGRREFNVSTTTSSTTSPGADPSTADDPFAGPSGGETKTFDPDTTGGTTTPRGGGSTGGGRSSSGGAGPAAGETSGELTPSEQRAVENRRAGGLGGSQDPAFRGDLFRDPAQQTQARERIEQQLLAQMGRRGEAGVINLETGEVDFRRVENGRGVAGTVDAREAFDVGPANTPTGFAQRLFDEARAEQRETEVRTELALAEAESIGSVLGDPLTPGEIAEIQRRVELGRPLTEAEISSIQASTDAALIEQEVATRSDFQAIDDFIAELDRAMETGGLFDFRAAGEFAREEGVSATVLPGVAPPDTPGGGNFLLDRADVPVFLPTFDVTEPTTTGAFGAAAEGRGVVEIGVSEQTFEEEAVQLSNDYREFVRDVFEAAPFTLSEQVDRFSGGELSPQDRAAAETLGLDEQGPAGEFFDEALISGVTIFDPPGTAKFVKDLGEIGALGFEETVAGRGGKLVEFEDIDVSTPEAFSAAAAGEAPAAAGVDVLSGGFVEEIERASSGAIDEAIEELERSYREDPALFAAQATGSLAGSALLIGGATAASTRLGRGVAFGIQPGEELASAGLTRAAPGLAAKFPGGRIDNEEIFIREMARIERATTKKLGELGRAARRVEIEPRFGAGLAPPKIRFKTDLEQDLDAYEERIRREVFQEGVDRRLGVLRGERGGLTVSGFKPELELEPEMGELDSELQRELDRVTGELEQELTAELGRTELRIGQEARTRQRRASAQNLEGLLEFELEGEGERTGVFETELEFEIGRTELQLDQELDAVLEGRFEFEVQGEPEQEFELELELDFEREFETESFGFDSGRPDEFVDFDDSGGFFERLLDFPARRDPFGDFTEELEDVTGELLTGFDDDFDALERDLEARFR